MHIVFAFLNNPLKYKTHVQLKSGARAGSVGQSLRTVQAFPRAFLKTVTPVTLVGPRREPHPRAGLRLSEGTSPDMQV